MYLERQNTRRFAFYSVKVKVIYILALSLFLKLLETTVNILDMYTDIVFCLMYRRESTLHGFLFVPITPLNFMMNIFIQLILTQYGCDEGLYLYYNPISKIVVQISRIPL